MSKSLKKNIERNRGKVGLSTLLIVSLLVVTGVIQLARNNTVDAAAITSASDTLSSSAPAASSSHTIVFTTPTGLVSGATMTISFNDAGFTTGTLDFEDIDIEIESADVSVADTASGPTWGATTTGQDTGWLFTNGNVAVNSGDVVTIIIGDIADYEATGDENMSTPGKVLAVGVADVYTVTIGGSFGDSGDILIAIIDQVTVSVTIDETLTFTISAVDLADCNTKFGSEPGATTTTTTVPFGAVTNSNTFNHACHDLLVSTNASSGYVMTVETDTSLKSGGSVLINNGVCDTNCDASTDDTWVTTSQNGFAYTCDGTDCATASNTQYRTFACTGATTTDCLPGGGETAQTFSSNSGAVNNSTTTIEYRLNLNGTQEAGTYTNTVTYITTPTY